MARRTRTRLLARATPTGHQGLDLDADPALRSVRALGGRDRSRANSLSAPSLPLRNGFRSCAQVPRFRRARNRTSGRLWSTAPMFATSTACSMPASLRCSARTRRPSPAGTRTRQPSRSATASRTLRWSPTSWRPLRSVSLPGSSRSSPTNTARRGYPVRRCGVHRPDIPPVLLARCDPPSLGRHRPAGRRRLPRLGIARSRMQPVTHRESLRRSRSARQRSSRSSSSASASSRSRRFARRASRRLPMSAIRKASWPRSPGVSSYMLIT